MNHWKYSIRLCALIFVATCCAPGTPSLTYYREEGARSCTPVLGRHLPGSRNVPRTPSPKAAFTRLSVTSPRARGKEGIRANAVVSGFVLTEKARKLTNADFQQHWLNLARSPRLGEPDDIAAAVTMLFSEDGAWINGQAICVDGGTVLH